MGRIAGIHIDRVYNSYSETLTIADNDVDRTFISKNDNRIENLRNIISNSNFFNMEPKHGDPSDCCDLIHSTMSISMGELMELKIQTQSFGMTPLTQQSLNN